MIETTEGQIRNALSFVGVKLEQSTTPWIFYCHEPAVKWNTSTKIIFFKDENVCNSVATTLGDLVTKKGDFHLTYGDMEP